MFCSFRFHLILNEDSNDHGLPRRHTSLQFVETNEFKHLCHLSLRVMAGSDNEIKKHMALKIKKLKVRSEIKFNYKNETSINISRTVIYLGGPDKHWQCAGAEEPDVKCCL